MAIKVKKVEEEVDIKDLTLLEAELNGVSYKSGESTIEIPGILSQKIYASVKVHLLNVVEVVAKQKKNYLELRDELIKKHGKEKKAKDGSISYDLKDNMEEFQKEELDLQSQKIKLTLPKFNSDDLFDFKTEQVYANAARLLVDYSGDE